MPLVAARVASFRRSAAVVSSSALVQGQAWVPIVGDWFWERDQLTRYYRLVEACNASAQGLPCNPMSGCAFQPSPSPGDGCEKQLATDGCMAKWRSTSSCESCAEKHEADLQAAGCTRKAVQSLCEAVEPAAVQVESAVA